MKNVKNHLTICIAFILKTLQKQINEFTRLLRTETYYKHHTNMKQMKAVSYRSRIVISWNQMSLKNSSSLSQ